MLPLQKRWLADEAATAQSEPVAESTTQTQGADDSVAQASESESPTAEPPKTETQAVETTATSQTPVDTTTLENPSSSTAESITNSAQDVASRVAASVTSPAASVEEDARDVTPLARSAPGTQYGQPSDTVYVGNLFFDVRAEDLKKEFSRAGEVLDAKIITDARGLSKGYAHTLLS